MSSQHPKARLCHIKKWADFDGYGFNLHAEKGRPGQYVGKVDERSPAETAGLRQGDRILEVNGVSIADKNHKQVVELIKSCDGETQLLVLDPHEEANEPDEDDVEEDGRADTNGASPSPPSTMMMTTTTTTMTNKNGTLNLKMTAAELRAKLAARKKFDPKKETMDFKQKFDIVQKL